MRRSLLTFDQQGRNPLQSPRPNRRRLPERRGLVVPRIDISALFSDSAAGREEADAAIIKAAGEIGFMTICGLPSDVPIDAASRRTLLRLFDLPEAELRKLWRQK